MTVSDKVLLDLSSGDLSASLYSGEPKLVAKNVDGLVLSSVDTEMLEADEDMVMVTFELAVEVDVEDRAGRRVAVLSAPGGDK